MNPPFFDADLVFIHLSDIHFSGIIPKSNHDPDDEIRRELRNDLNKLKAFLEINAILVSGDIAYSGKLGEFRIAESWLQSIAQELDLDKNSILVTPGNHDIDRSIISNDPEISKIHAKIRKSNGSQASDGTLAKLLSNKSESKLLLKSMKAYNSFASQYQCSVTADLPYWERIFPLSDGKSVLLRGITSTLISGPKDHKDKAKLIYGPAQRNIAANSHTHHIIMAHHPTSWLIDGTEADKLFSKRALLQLYGHEHDSWIMKMGIGLRIIAGALQPSRTEPAWSPRYSAIALKLTNLKKPKIRVYPRRFSDTYRVFMPDYDPNGQEFQEHELS